MTEHTHMCADTHTHTHTHRVSVVRALVGTEALSSSILACTHQNSRTLLLNPSWDEVFRHGQMSPGEHKLPQAKNHSSQLQKGPQDGCGLYLEHSRSSNPKQSTFPDCYGLPLELSSFCSSVSQYCLTLCNPMDYSTPGLPVRHQLPEFTQTHVH